MKTISSGSVIGALARFAVCGYCAKCALVAFVALRVLVVLLFIDQIPTGRLAASCGPIHVAELKLPLLIERIEVRQGNVYVEQCLLRFDAGQHLFVNIFSERDGYKAVALSGSENTPEDGFGSYGTHSAVIWNICQIRTSRERTESRFEGTGQPSYGSALVYQVERKRVEYATTGPHFKKRWRLDIYWKKPGSLAANEGITDFYRGIGAQLSCIRRTLASVNEFAVFLQGAPKDNSLSKEGRELDDADGHQPSSERREPPIYLQILIGLGLGGAFFLVGFDLLIFRGRPIPGVLALAVGVFFSGSGFSALLFGHWWSWWTFRWLRGEW